ncbi:hypothetical protein IE53DRAFT_39224 [Violaceomyces palustris]|uniref:Uncharacterized protein n=1 Tax=Violaceomyces palustris TaxID=1673888 RepID=A0ACD0P7L0_9BASI|nr:hypothetical protein IE53DRAFT_39224 [Violaceomyces palustris]
MPSSPSSSSSPLPQPEDRQDLGSPSSPDDSLALAKDLKERQAAAHFPTLAKRSSKRRPKLPEVGSRGQSDEPEYGQEDLDEPKVDPRLREQLEEGRLELQGGEAGLLEADAIDQGGLSLTEGGRQNTDDGEGNEVGEETDAQQSQEGVQPSLTCMRRSRPSTSSSGKRRMTVLMDGEMPEGHDQSSEDDDEEDDEEEEDEEDEEDEEEESADEGAEEDEDEEESGSEGEAVPKKKGKLPQNGKGRPTTAKLPVKVAAGKESGSKEGGSGDASDDESSVAYASSERETEEGSDEEEEDSDDDDDDDDGGDDDGDAEEDDSDSEEEVEPSLKYQRIKGGAMDILSKDTASAFAISSRFMALGTHGGMVYILDVEGNLVKGFRSHTASILDLDIDSTSEFVASASMDGMVSISALSTSEQYVFDFKRPMRCIALEPNFGKKSTRAFVCGGMAGALVQREKSWFGHKEIVLHAGEGPIWSVEWRANLIAWANDKGVRIYDTNTHQRISFISPPSANPRADLFRCSLYWQDDRTLLVAWADNIKIVKVKEKKPAPTPGPSLTGLGSQHPQLFVEISAIFQLDCMISGIAPYGRDYLVLAYLTEEVYDDDEAVDDRELQRRKEGHRPELRIISRAGEELSSDVLSLNSFSRFQCNDYLLVPSAEARALGAAVHSKRLKQDPESSSYYVVSPKDIVISRPRDEKDHVDWLLERKRYEEALVKVEALGTKQAKVYGYDAEDIGKKYLSWLVEENNYERAAKVASKILGRNVQAWEDWIFLFVEKGMLGTAIPYIPTSDPTLSGLVYDMILAHFLQHDPDTLLKTIKEWPPQIYSTQAVVIAIEDRLQREKSSRILMECLAELYIANHQPSKALPFFLRLRRPNVFDLIRDNNLFTAVQDQALLLIEFEQDLLSTKKQGPDASKVREGGSVGGEASSSKHGAAIDLLVDHTHSIPIHRVIKQLENQPKFLYMYLDALFDRDSQLVSDFSDLQVKLYAEFEYSKLMAYLRAMSSYYSFDKAYNICKEHDYVPEMVFLLGRVGDNKRAMSLIIERLGDVERAIDFAKEQSDDDLWEDLLRYSETKPAFIRGLLENVGAEIDPIRLIRRIKNGLEIPGLKPALIKILHDFNLQISLLEGCEAILSHDKKVLAAELDRSQSRARYCDFETFCANCSEPLFVIGNYEISASSSDRPPTIMFLCDHAYHLSCLIPPANIPVPKKQDLPKVLITTTQAASRVHNRLGGWGEAGYIERSHSSVEVSENAYGPQRRARENEKAFEMKLAYEARLRAVLRKGCLACRKDSAKAF